MIEPSRGLPETVRTEIAELEQRVVAADGGRLKLEWGSLRSRPDTEVNDLLVRRDGRLVGFCGLYTFGSPPELNGMVDPDHRGAGIGGELLDAALAACGARGFDQVLLIVPRASAAGHRLALSRGGTPDHSEHALALHEAPPAGDDEAQPFQIRAAVADDAGAVARLLAVGFGRPVDPASVELGRTRVVEQDTKVVGTLVVERGDERAGVYGFVVDPALQGRGIGRATLRRTCRELFADGVREVHLEVASQNDRALGLYTSLGFTRVTTEDYVALTPAL